MQETNPLRAARLARGLSLETIEAQTRLAPHLIEKIDAGRFAELPAGLYARAYIRAVAKAVGLDGDEVIQVLGPCLPETPDPMPVLRDLVQRSEIPLSPRIAGWLAAAADGVLIGLATGGVAMFVETCTGTKVASGGAEAVAALLVIAAIVAVPYFLILAGIGGRTPGQQLAGAAAIPSIVPLTPRGIARRAVFVCLSEGSIVVDVAVTLAPADLLRGPWSLASDRRGA
jgi:hypothetical protein